jgi:vancomycin resistance protein VanW
MKNIFSIEKPQHRGPLRKYLGREFFILKRRLKWMFGNTHFAKVKSNIDFRHSVIQHRSMLLRPLKDVDMFLQYNKVTNLKLAIQHLHAVVIEPGQTFSLWRLVGRPTKSKGYLEGMTLHNGKVSKDTGGGLCQLGNLIYWMALHTPLTIQERWRHGYDVFPDVNRTIPFACGATLSYNYVDLQLKNNTSHSFQLKLWLDDVFLHGEILCDCFLDETYEIVETDHHFAQQSWGGYSRHNKIWKRKTSLPTQEITEELVSENHAIMMYSPFIDC